MVAALTPVADGTNYGEVVDGKLYGRSFLNDTTGADAMGLVTASPETNTLLGRLKAISDGVTALAGVEFFPTVQPVSGTVSISGTVAVSGNVGITGSVAVTGTFWQDTQPISAASLPLPTGAATSAKQDNVIAALATVGTRAYGAGQQVSIAATSNASTGLAATEVLLHASVRCFVRVATAATSAAGIPLEAGEKFHLRLTSGQQIHVIRDTEDGTLNVVPVA